MLSTAQQHQIREAIEDSSFANVLEYIADLASQRADAVDRSENLTKFARQRMDSLNDLNYGLEASIAFAIEKDL